MKTSLTYELNGLPDFYRKVLGCYTLAAKNVRNSSLFIINNIKSSYHYNDENKTYIIIENLHQNQKDVLNYVNRAITILNQKKLGKQKNKENSKDTVKLFSYYTNVIDKSTYYQIFDKTLLENALKYKESVSEYKDYTIIHSSVAQSVVHNLCDDFQNGFKALKSHKNGSEGFNGKPQMPKYKDKTEDQSFSISAQGFTDKGQLIKIGKNHVLYQDYNKKLPVLKDLSIPFNDFNLLEFIKRDIAKRGLDKKRGVTYEIAEVRVIAGKHKQLPTVEYVVSFERELKDFFPDIIAKSILLKGKEFFKLKDKDKLEVVKEYFNNDYRADKNNHNSSNSNKDIPYFMSVDLGVVNFATVCYFTENKNTNLVISGKKLKHKIDTLDGRID